MYEVREDRLVIKPHGVQSDTSSDDTLINGIVCDLEDLHGGPAGDSLIKNVASHLSC